MAPTKKPSIAPTPQLSSLEFNSLHDFYNATHGPWWRWQNVSSTSVPWNFSIPNVNPCLDYWQGLQCLCGLTTCEVVMIYLDHHNLTGHLPDSMRNFPKMQSLILRGNNITGTITESIGSMSELEQLDLSYNRFKGEIPTSIGNLVKVRVLNFGWNLLSSSIPVQLYQLDNLIALSLFNNLLEGFISPNIGNLTGLRTLQLQFNYLGQSIPNEICHATHLRTIDIGQNVFDGSIPSCMYDMVNLTSIVCLNNHLSGRLDDRIGNLTNLISLEIGKNHLVGTLPSSLGNLKKLSALELNNNFFTGTIPHSLVNLTNLVSFFIQVNSLHGKIDFLSGMNITIFYVQQNFFTGSFIIPQDGFVNAIYFDVAQNLLTGSMPWSEYWTRLTIYQSYGNYFTGTVPLTANLPKIIYFIAAINYLSSSIPPNFLLDATRIYEINLSENLLTNSIPQSFGNFSYLNQMVLSSNFLTGFVPNLQGDIRLVVLDISSNLLRGTIPSTLTSLRFLEEIFIAGNSLTGGLDDFLNATLQRRLVNIDVSENEFSGTIPIALFTDSFRLQSFAAASNCFQGSLPAEICETKQLVSLSLDGLTTSDSCKSYLLNGIPFFNGFTVHHFLQGSIPPCFYDMPHLELLHISGNGLTGTIPNDLNFSSVLTDLSLSHNSLSGTIPRNVQLRSWQNLDLSYNKLTGTLISDFASPIYDDDGSSGSIVLDINRLSGSVPSSLIHNSTNVQMLQGNIFSCDISATDLPHSDPDYNTYSCGSDSVNDVLYSWIGLFLCIPLVLLLVIRLTTSSKGEKKSTIGALGRDLVDYWKTWKEALRSEPVNVNLPRLSIYFSEMRRGTLKLALYCTLILIPLFSILKMDYSSYTIEYAWSISAMLMNGEVAAILLFVGLMCFAVLYLIIFKQIVARLNVRMPKEKETGNLSEEHHRISKEEKSSRKPVVPENLRDIAIIYSVVSLINLIIMAAADFSYVYTVINYNSITIASAAFGLALFRLLSNNIILWRALPETSRFLVWIKGLISGNHENRTKSESRSYLEYTTRDISFIENLVLFNNIIIPGLAIIFILRDCFYNALFAADNVSSTYAYNSCYQYSWLVFGATHLCHVFTNTVEYSPPFIYSYQCSSKIVINYVPVYILMFILAGVIIPLLKLLLKVIYDKLPNEKESLKGKLRNFIELFLPEYFKDLRNNVRITRASENPRNTLSGILSMSIFGKGKALLFSKLSVTVQINSYLTILVCFGALFPPLAIIAALTICSITYFEELWIGWLLTETRQLGIDYGWYEEQIEKECEGVEESSNLTIWSTLLVSCSLYGYIIFDTMGDKTGWEAALPMTLLMILLPLPLLLWIRFKKQFHPSPLNPQLSSLRSSLIRDGGLDDLTPRNSDNPQFLYSGSDLISNENICPEDSKDSESFSLDVTENPMRQSKIQLISIDRFSSTSALKDGLP